METRKKDVAADPFGDLMTACDRAVAAFKALGSAARETHDAAESLTAYCAKVEGRAAA